MATIRLPRPADPDFFFCQSFLAQKNAYLPDIWTRLLHICRRTEPARWTHRAVLDAPMASSEAGQAERGIDSTGASAVGTAASRRGAVLGEGARVDPEVLTLRPVSGLLLSVL